MKFLIIFSVISILLTLIVSSKRINPFIRDGSFIGTLVSTAVLGRVSMFSVPNVQPVTFLVILSGYTYGCKVGFISGFCTAIISNFALGQGPWTIWQAFAWGLAGASGGILKRIIKEPKRAVLVGVAVVWGYAFGVIMDVSGWLMFMPVHTLQTYLAMNVSSFAFNTAHAIGNGLFMFALGIPIINGIEKIRLGIYGLVPQTSKQNL